MQNKFVEETWKCFDNDFIINPGFASYRATIVSMLYFYSVTTSSNCCFKNETPLEWTYKKWQNDLRTSFVFLMCNETISNWKQMEKRAWDNAWRRSLNILDVFKSYNKASRFTHGYLWEDGHTPTDFGSSTARQNSAKKIPLHNKVSKDLNYRPGSILPILSNNFEWTMLALIPAFFFWKYQCRFPNSYSTQHWKMEQLCWQKKSFDTWLSRPRITHSQIDTALIF